MALGDVDGDGDVDLVCGNVGEQNRLYLNSGSGTFIDATILMPIDTDHTGAVALGDIDGDGDLDIVCGNGDGNPPFVEQDRLYLNNGTGAFTDVTGTQLPLVSDMTSAVALGDVDNDGDLDIVFGSQKYPGQNKLYLNNGSGTFSNVTGSQMPTAADFTNSVALGDVDGDGDLDMVSTNGLGGRNKLYLNNGSGTFGNVTGSHMPVIPSFLGSINISVGGFAAA